MTLFLASIARAQFAQERNIGELIRRARAANRRRPLGDCRAPVRDQFGFGGDEGQRIVVRLDHDAAISTTCSE